MTRPRARASCSMRRRQPSDTHQLTALPLLACYCRRFLKNQNGRSVHGLRVTLSRGWAWVGSGLSQSREKSVGEEATRIFAGKFFHESGCHELENTIKQTALVPAGASPPSWCLRPLLTHAHLTEIGRWRPHSSSFSPRDGLASE